jgi:PAS domain S-box-containing protein
MSGDAQERYHRLFDRSLAGLFRTTSGGAIVECNESFARALGASSPAELVDRSFKELYAEPARWDRLMAGLEIARIMANIETPLRRSDGAVTWVLLAIMRASDEPDADLEGQIIDINAKKRADESLRETEALRSVATLAAAAAHEINNPLNVLKGNLQLLARDVDPRVFAERVAPAIEAAKRIEEIVRRMNRVTRLETEQAGTLPDMLNLRRSSSAD